MNLLNVIGWVVLGMSAGFVASVIANRRIKIMLADILIGIGGALASGWLFGRIGRTGIAGFDAWDFLAAAVGSVVLLIIWHAIRGLPRRA